jgi:hypothetical protein
MEALGGPPFRTGNGGPRASPVFPRPLGSSFDTTGAQVGGPGSVCEGASKSACLLAAETNGWQISMVTYNKYNHLILPEPEVP